MELRNKIQYVLDSDMSGYRIDKEFGISQPIISYLRNGNRTLDGIELITIEKFLEVYEYLKNEGD